MFIVDEYRRIESLTIGDGRLPPDALAALEAKAAALERQSASSSEATAAAEATGATAAALASPESSFIDS